MTFESITEQIRAIDDEFGTGRITFGGFLHLLGFLDARSPIRDNTDFQFNKGVAKSNKLVRLKGVILGKTAGIGVTIKNIDADASIMLVTTVDKAAAGTEPVKAKCYWVLPGDTLKLEISKPDKVLVSGNDEDVTYTWYSR